MPSFWNFPLNSISAFHGDPVVVRRPEKYGDIFHRGEAVLNVHFNATTPRETVNLLRAALRDIPMMKALGYKGIIGTTSNRPLIRFARKLGAAVLPVSRRTRRKFRDNYANASRDGDADPKYLSKRVLLVVWRFPGE